MSHRPQIDRAEIDRLAIDRSVDRSPETRWSVPRRSVLAVAAALAAVPWAHALAAILRSLVPGDPPAAAVPLTVAAVLVAAVGAAALPGRRAGLAAALAGLAALAAFAAAIPGAWVAGLALPVVGAAVTAGARRLGRRLPASVDAAWSRRRKTALVWAAVSLLAVVQVGRLSSFLADGDVEFALGTRNPFWFGHQCLSAYLHGAELAERGDPDLYHPHHWPALDAEAAPATDVRGMVVEDPYQYPPQFLLLPAVALAVSDDYEAIRTVWFALNLTLFAAAFAGLALWAGGRAGRLCLWLGPAVLATFPVLYNFQFGQFHLAAVSLAVLAMLAFAHRRPAAGGLLLAAAVLAKMFPAVLLVPLAARRRWRELGWTAAWAAVATVAALAVFGTAPYEAFLTGHLPRLGDGAAFAFDEAWPEIAEVVVADNQGVFGLARKAGLSKGAAARVGRAFGLLVLLAAALLARRIAGASPWARGSAWLALLGLASLASPGAWGDYVPTTAVWLLALTAAAAVENRRLLVPLAAVALLQAFLLGTMPIGDWMPMELMIPVSAAGAAAMLGLFAFTLARRPAPAQSTSWFRSSAKPTSSSVTSLWK